MSYVIAFVTFPEPPDVVYPVEAFRVDLAVGDEVIVRRKDGKLKIATVSRLQFLNWDCTARIECKLSEAKADGRGHLTLPVNSPIEVGLEPMVH